MTLGKTVPELDTEADVVGTDLFATYRSPGPLKKVTALTTRTYMSALSAAKAANLSDLADIPTARANLDLVVPPLLMAGALSALGNSPYWIKVREPDAVLFVLLANDFSLQSYSLADPANPALLDAVAVGTSGAGPAYLALDGAGNVYVTDQNTNTLRVVDASGIFAHFPKFSIRATPTRPYLPGGPAGLGAGGSAHLMLSGASCGLSDGGVVMSRCCLSRYRSG